ncbi:MAG TPA: GDSL-type esterase/lipase family protein [Frankiaceae bacterium]|nr:GDSL-type esterase/lipase family protein [Frankiaceae bacterium]
MIRRTRRLLCSLAAVAAAATLGVAPEPAAAAGVRIYPLGDSITYGATWYVGRPAQLPPEVPYSTVGVDSPGGYRAPLTLALTAQGVTHEMVGTSTANSNAVLDQLGQNRHNGHPGYRIDQNAAALDGRGPSSDLGGYWLTGTATRAPITPDVTVIHLGTNDIGQRYDPGTTYPNAGGKVNYANAAQRAAFVGNLTARLQALVDKVQALRPGSRIVLSNVTPWAAAPNDRVTYEYAQAISALVAGEQGRGERVVYADVWSAFATVVPATPAAPETIAVIPGLLSPDNVHPTPAGYAAMAAVYAQAIPAALALP